MGVRTHNLGAIIAAVLMKIEHKVNLLWDLCYSFLFGGKIFATLNARAMRITIMGQCDVILGND